MLNKWCLIYIMLGCIYAHLVGMRDLDNSFHISYLYIENFLIYGTSMGEVRREPYKEVLLYVPGVYLRLCDK